MKTLVVEDEFTSRILLQEILRPYGPVHVAVNGKEAVEAVRMALDGGKPYDLICLDIMMPEMDGQTALKHIRSVEKVCGARFFEKAKIIMTTAVADRESVIEAARGSATYFIVKPVRKDVLLEQLRVLGLIS